MAIAAGAVVGGVTFVALDKLTQLAKLHKFATAGGAGVAALGIAAIVVGGKGEGAPAPAPAADESDRAARSRAVLEANYGDDQGPRWVTAGTGRWEVLTRPPIDDVVFTEEQLTG